MTQLVAYVTTLENSFYSVLLKKPNKKFSIQITNSNYTIKLVIISQSYNDYLYN